MIISPGILMVLLLATSLKSQHCTHVLRSTIIAYHLSETFVNSSIENDDNRLKIDGYYLIRSDHPGGLKKRGVCIYFKEPIPLIRRDGIYTLSN